MAGPRRRAAADDRERHGRGAGGSRRPPAAFPRRGSRVALDRADAHRVRSGHALGAAALPLGRGGALRRPRRRRDARANAVAVGCAGVGRRAGDACRQTRERRRPSAGQRRRARVPRWGRRPDAARLGHARPERHLLVPALAQALLARRRRDRPDRDARVLGRRRARVIAHWDEVEGERAEQGHLAGMWFDLGTAAGSRNVGVTRIRVDPARWSTPAHVELDEEEIYFVLAGSGLLWQGEKTHEVRAGDCVVQRVADEAHTFRAGEDGLDILAFGERTNPTATYLPRAQVMRMGVTLDVSAGPHPWEREAAAGEPDLPAPSERPTNIVHPDAVEADYDGDAGRWVTLARKAGAVRTGLNWGRLEPGGAGAPPHCHSADEEIFVILDGSGTLELWPSPARE